MVNASTYLADNRFGLGLAVGAPAMPADPVPALLAQLAAFDPAPVAIAGLASRETLAQIFTEYRAQPRLDDNAIIGGAGNRNGSPAMTAATPAPVVEVSAPLRRHYADAAAARLALATGTSAPFGERLVHFWSNHFAVSANSQPVLMMAGDYEHRAIRPHIMGRFANLLKAAVLHPAMLLFLDQAQSVGPNSWLAQRAAQRAKPDADRRVPGLNENLGREILELHTLGVRTGYSQGDVGELARALTGWTVAGLGGRGDRLTDRFAPGARRGDTLFLPIMHEGGPRTIMGTRFSQAGRDQALAILDQLAVHPATARHIATKLARHFSADTPVPALVDRLARRFLDTGGELMALYQELVTAPEAWQTDAPKFKSPWDWTVSALRATGAATLPGRRGLLGLLDQMGQPVWRPGSPAGYDDVAASWAGAAGLMLRAEAASRIAAAVPAAASPVALARAVLADAAHPDTLAAISRADSPAQGVALTLMAPAFLRR